MQIGNNDFPLCSSFDIYYKLFIPYLYILYVNITIIPVLKLNLIWNERNAYIGFTGIFIIEINYFPHNKCQKMKFYFLQHILLR